MKIGIVSHYYNSLNYGGNLQAYALCEILRQYGVDAKQICLQDRNAKLPWAQANSQEKLLGAQHSGELVSLVLRKGCRIVKKAATRLFLKNLKQKRIEAFSRFNRERIPHSPKVYSHETIAECVHDYDAFITGSDQVWNLNWYNPAYFLTFVPEGKPKFSYGASMGVQELTGQERDLVRTHVHGYIGISVRESMTADMLANALERDVEWVLDPTLLLTRQQWDEVCLPRIIEGKYLFCYFLGSAPSARRLAKKYAKQNGLQIVTIPHLYGDFVAQDVLFGDTHLDAPSPEELLSLIKYADCIFTDSFHVTAFSAIYQREYFVFPRAGSKGMDDRIYSLTSLLGSESRFCDTSEKKQPEYLLGCAPLEHGKTAAMAEMEYRSRQYIKNCLQTAEKWMKDHET